MSEVIELHRPSPAVEVHDLRKEFSRRDKKAGRFARRRRCRASRSRWSGASASRSWARTARASRPWSGSSRRCSSTTAAARGVRARRLHRPRPVRKLVNRVSVEASFFKKMSAGENLHYAARYYGMGPRETRVKIPAILTKVGFPIDRRSEPMENLSRGMQQKVALARALLTSPVLLLLDEPTTGLDPRSKLEVQDFVREVRQTHDATILLCTRPRRGGGPGGPRRRPRPRRAALPRDRARDPRSASASRRSSRRSSRPPAASSRRRWTRTTRTGRCSHESRSFDSPRRADRARRRRRAQRLPDPPLHLVGRRLHGLDDRERSRSSSSRRRDRGDGARSTSTARRRSS